MNSVVFIAILSSAIGLSKAATVDQACPSLLQCFNDSLALRNQADSIVATIKANYPQSLNDKQKAFVDKVSQLAQYDLARRNYLINCVKQKSGTGKLTGVNAILCKVLLAAIKLRSKRDVEISYSGRVKRQQTVTSGGGTYESYDIPTEPPTTLATAAPTTTEPCDDEHGGGKGGNSGKGGNNGKGGNRGKGGNSPGKGGKGDGGKGKGKGNKGGRFKRQQTVTSGGGTYESYDYPTEPSVTTTTAAPATTAAVTTAPGVPSLNELWANLVQVLKQLLIQDVQCAGISVCCPAAATCLKDYKNTQDWKNACKLEDDLEPEASSPSDDDDKPCAFSASKNFLHSFISGFNH